MDHEYIRLLEEMVSLAWAEQLRPLAGFAFYPADEGEGTIWHLTAVRVDGLSAEKTFALPKPTFAPKGGVMAAYEAAAACLCMLKSSAH